MIDEDATVRLRPLSVVEDGDDVLVGDPEAGVFVTVPPVGGVVVRALGRGATVGEAAAEAERLVGQSVDLEGFVGRLRRLGFVDDDADGDRRPRRSAPFQQRRWIGGVSPRAARPFFGRMAWVCYTVCALYSVGCLIVLPDLWPTPADAFFHDNVALSGLVLYTVTLLTTALHECWHWLAARAAGVRARFGIDLRVHLLVFETDLSQLWAVPRRRRFGPLLAGLAVDFVVLALVLAIEVAASWWPLPDVLVRLLGTVAFVKVVTITWQCFVFLRTDLYAVMVTATGCRNLWRVKSLLLRRAFGRLTPKQRTELAEAAPRDLAVGRWFRWVWLAGFVVTAAWFLGFSAPVLLTVLQWAGEGLATGPLTSGFWLTLAGAAVLLWTPAVTLVVAVRAAFIRRATAA